MPELCRFFGIIVRMYAEFDSPHHTLHFHAYYQGEAAVFGIEPVDLLAGNLPRRQRRLVEAWAELYNEELMENWNHLQAGEPAMPISPIV